MEIVWICSSSQGELLEIFILDKPNALVEISYRLKNSKGKSIRLGKIKADFQLSYQSLTPGAIQRFSTKMSSLHRNSQVNTSG